MRLLAGMRKEDDGGMYSGSSSVTQSVFSFSSFAMMMTLSPGLPSKAGMFSTLLYRKVFCHDAAM